MSSRISTVQVVNKVIELAMSDPDSDVRAEACRGLRGQVPRVAIPVLLAVMHEDGANIDPLSATTPPDAMAAFVLDELLNTSFMELRLGGGYSTTAFCGYHPPLNLFLFLRDLSEADTFDIVQMLIDAGADPSIPDYKGDTSADNATQSGKQFVLPLLSKSD